MGVPASVRVVLVAVVWCALACGAVAHARSADDWLRDWLGNLRVDIPDQVLKQGGLSVALTDLSCGSFEVGSLRSETNVSSVTALAFVSLRSEPTSNDPQDRSVSATESPPCFKTWSGMSTRRLPSQSRSQSSAERACATAPHARAHHTAATSTARTDAATPIFAASLRARRAKCASTQQV